MQGVFITGTGTDVGKTFVGTAVARALSEQNINVIPRKPVESGCVKHNNELIPEDATALKKAANFQGDLDEVCHYRFEPAISPVRAAHLAKTILTTEQLVNICLNGSENGFTLVEGAGGFYSPIAENGLNADLAVALQLPVLLVADDKLGALNQVLLSVEAIKSHGLQLIGVVLNSLTNDKNENMDNAADLREYLDCPVFTSPFKQEENAELPRAILPRALIDTLISTYASDKPAITAVS